MLVPMGAPAPSTPRRRNNAAVVVGIAGFFILVVLPAAAPIAAIVFGVLVVASYVSYVTLPKVRGWIDRVPAVSRMTRVKRYLAATGLALVGSTPTCLGIGVLRAEADERARQVADRERAEEREAAQQVELEESLAAFDVAMAREDLTAAQEALGAAVDVDDGDPEVVARAKVLKAAARERELARLPELLENIRHASGQAQWEVALEVCSEAEGIDSGHAELKKACDGARAGHLEAQFPEFVSSASRVAEDETKCGIPLEIQNAWENLRKIPAGHESFRAAEKAAAGLERCRKQVKRWLIKGTHDVMQSQREAWASNYESSLLDEGIDVRVSLGGKRKARIKIKYVLLNRAGVHQITKDGTFLANLEEIGFERVTFSDGFYESWYYDLEPEDVDRAVVETTLKPMGLDEKLEL